jgi:hypothetical protein
MNDNLKSVLVSYGTEEHQKQLENYISHKTGKKVDFGRMDYDGKGTILRISLDLTYIARTNVTAAIWFPGMKFRGEIDEFIKWHSRISDMHYPEAVKEATDPADVIALYYQEEKDEISYICFRMSYQWEIEKYLVSSDGKALPFENNGRKYWLLLSEVNGNMIMFTKTDYSNTPFMHVSSDLKDLEFFRYLISM